MVKETKNSEKDSFQSEEERSREHEVRVQKVETLRKQGIEPWPYREKVNATCAQIVDEFKEDQNGHDYAVAGRIMTIRLHGKTAFAHIQDRTGRLQIYIRKDAVGDKAFEFFEQFVDMGDIVWFSGKAFKTKTGEVTLRAEHLKLLSKSLNPLPEKFHGLADIETIYRQRYLDLISNPESKDRFLKRSAIISTMRSFLEEHDFIEVETPLLHPIPGGAAARPFITYHNVLDMDLYLRIAPELYLKRLVVGGFDRVYEIGRCFRNEGVSTRHNPEFTMAEFYVAYEDYHFMMDLIEKLFKVIAQKVVGSLKVPFGDKIIDLEKPFARLTMHDAVKKYANLTDRDLSPEYIDETIRNKGLEFSQKASWGTKLFFLFEELAESNIEQPTYIIGYPVEVSPLSKRDPHDPQKAARFELFIAGLEFGNGFNELNDPFDQAERFREQAELKAAGDQEAHYYDADYVRALEHGLPPTVGAGIGIDRLTMLMTNTTSIRDVILFPTLKKK